MHACMHAHTSNMHTYMHIYTHIYYQNAYIYTHIRMHIITHRGLQPGAGDLAWGESTVEAFEAQLRRGFGKKKYTTNKNKIHQQITIEAKL